jgi:hypothetical protein
MAALLSDERVYGELALARPLLPRELKRQHVGAHAIMGAAFQKTNNLQILAGGSHVVMVAGSGVSIMSETGLANGHLAAMLLFTAPKRTVVPMTRSIREIYAPSACIGCVSLPITSGEVCSARFPLLNSVDRVWPLFPAPGSHLVRCLVVADC